MSEKFYCPVESAEQAREIALDILKGSSIREFGPWMGNSGVSEFGKISCMGFDGRPGWMTDTKDDTGAEWYDNAGYTKLTPREFIEAVCAAMPREIHAHKIEWEGLVENRKYTRKFMAIDLCQQYDEIQGLKEKMHNLEKSRDWHAEQNDSLIKQRDEQAAKIANLEKALEAAQGTVENYRDAADKFSSIENHLRGELQKGIEREVMESDRADEHVRENKKLEIITEELRRYNRELLQHFAKGGE